MSGARGGRGRLLTGAALLAVIAAAILFFPVTRWLGRAHETFAGLGTPGIVLFAIVYALAAVLFIPGSALTIAAGAVYGLGRGFLAVSAGSTAGAAAAFLIARYLARERVERRAARDPRFAAIDRAVGREGFRIVLLTRLSPVFPFTLLNYLYGLTRVSFGAYLLASWIGMMPGTLLYVYLGSAGRAVARAAGGAHPRSTAENALFAIGLLATLAVTIYVTRLARRALRERTAISA